MSGLNSRPVLGSRTPEGKFQFFQPRLVDHFFEGRTPNANLKADSYGHLFPREIHLAIFFFLAALVLYLCSLSASPFPGIPSQTLVSVLPVNPLPPVLNPIWTHLIRGADALFHSFLPVSLFASLLAALFGALSVALLASLLMNVGYVLRNEPGPSSYVFEAYARRISAVSGSLFLAVSPSFWFAATRSLPHTFHVFLILLSARLYSRYQHWGRKRDLALLAASWGLGLAESPAFLVLSPFFLFLTIREMYYWGALRSWRAHLAFWGCLLAAAALLLPHAALLVRHGRALGLYPTLSSALHAVFSSEIAELQSVRWSPGFFALAAFLVIPWVTCFIFSRRSPWFFEDPQTSVHLLIALAFLCIPLNLSFSLWNLMFTFPLVVLPYAIMAGTFGYCIGGLFIHGDNNPLVEIPLRSKILRGAAFAVSLLTPVVLVVAGFLDFPALSARTAGFVAKAADAILDTKAPECDVFFSTGLLDSALRIRAHERRVPLTVINLPSVASPKYLRGIAQFYKNPEIRAALEKGDFDSFVRLLGTSHVGILDAPDYFRTFGIIVPSLFHYSLADAFASTDWPAVARAQAPAVRELIDLRRRDIDPGNPLDVCRESILRLASKNLDNLALFLDASGHPREAFDLLLDANAVDPSNLSVLLNLASFAGQFDLPPGLDPEKELRTRAFSAHGNRWNLSAVFGYVRDARSWVRKDLVWALSGTPYAPLDSEKVLYVHPDEDPAFVQWLSIVFNRFGDPLPFEVVCRARLQRWERDSAAFLDLAYLALCHRDTEVANAYLAEARAAGVDENDLLLYRAVILHLDGDSEAALELLRSNAAYAKSGEAWTLLLLLADETGAAADSDRARKAIAALRPGTPGLHLSLARYFLDRQDWPAAQRALDRAAALAPARPLVWELMGELAAKTGNVPLLKTSFRAIRKRQPDHFLVYLYGGLSALADDDLDTAAERFRKGLLRRRDPILLNNLALVLLLQGENLGDALACANEAVQRDPGTPAFLFTRARILAAMDRRNDALADFETLRHLGQITDRRILPYLRILLAAGRAEDARREALRFLRDNPGADPALARILSQVAEVGTRHYHPAPGAPRPPVGPQAVYRAALVDFRDSIRAHTLPPPETP